MQVVNAAETNKLLTSTNLRLSDPRQRNYSSSVEVIPISEIYQEAKFQSHPGAGGRDSV